MTTLGTRLREVGLLLAGGLLSIAVHAGDPPWVSSPSSDAVEGMIEVNGGGMPAGGQVVVSLVDQEGQVAESTLVDVDAAGRFSMDVNVAGRSGYVLEVWDPSGEGDTPLAFTIIAAGGS